MERNAELAVSSFSLRRKVLLVSVATIFSALLGLAITETTIRYRLAYVTPEITKNRSLQYSPSLFARNVFPQKEVRAYSDWTNREFYINENGYRGYGFAATKPEGVIRIIIYGGSAVFDPSQPEGKDWPHRVETILRENGFPQVEVINAGIPGHASFDCFGRLFAEGHVFNPDYLIFSNAWNDIKNFRSDRPLLRQLQPYKDDEDPRLNYQGTLDRFLCEHSQLYVRLRGRYYNWKLRVNAEGRVPEGEYVSDFNPAALKQYRIDQQMFVDLAREIGAVPVLMTEARLAAPDNTEGQKSRIVYESVKLTPQGLLKSYEAIEETVRQVASEKGVDLIDVRQDMDGKDEFFLDHVHLTAKGSEELAGITAQKLAELIRAKTSGKTSRQ